MLYKEFLAPRDYEKGQNKLPSQPEINHGNNYDWFHKGHAEFSIIGIYKYYILLI